jgi:hypothetical protein
MVTTSPPASTRVAHLPGARSGTAWATCDSRAVRACSWTTFGLRPVQELVGELRVAQRRTIRRLTVTLT